jgi:estrone sulfotransferase
MFSEGFSDHWPSWNHYLEYWRDSIARPDKVLFLKYEDVILEPLKHVIRLASFLGAPFSTREEEDGVPEMVVRLCSFEKLSSFPGNQTGGFTMLGDTVIEKSSYFRKGKVGDRVNHISEEMGKKLDCIVKEKLKGSGLVL